MCPAPLSSIMIEVILGDFWAQRTTSIHATPPPMHLLYQEEISRKMPFASGDAHSAGRKRSEAPPGADVFSRFGRLSERSQNMVQIWLDSDPGDLQPLGNHTSSGQCIYDQQGYPLTDKDKHMSAYQTISFEDLVGQYHRRPQRQAERESRVCV